MQQSQGKTTFARRETDLERHHRERDELPYQMQVDRCWGITTDYDFARKRGLVEYSRLGLRSRHDA